MRQTSEPNIESKAVEYYSRQVHESLCNTKLPYQVPRNNRTGETYDVYTVPRCNCWLSDNWDTLDLARKFEALRNLSRNYDGLHSAACASFKRTPIIYRDKPEYLTYGCDCWLSVRMQPEHTCPVCDKPLFFAPRAPQDTAKQACSDINCVNAHGLVDFGLPSRIDYNKDQEQRKEHTMGDLHIAKHRAETLEQAQRDIDNFLAPFVKQFVDFQIEINARGWDQRDLKADTFVEVEGGTFLLRGEEAYEYGETYVPAMNLPFEFVENPEQYKQKIRTQIMEEAEKTAARKKRDAQERVDRLKTQLAKAEADLTKAEAQKDSIKTIATRNQEQKLRAQLAQNQDQG